jgi:hypothetical protein
MKTRRHALASLAALLAACVRGPAPPPSADADPARPLPSPVPEVVARVNGQPIRIRQILPMAKAELDRVSIAEREAKTPEVMRRALGRYVDRELLLQEALVRGIRAETRDVDWAYDQMRGEYPDEPAWEEFLAGQGLDPRSFKVELRAQRTVAALLRQEAERRPELRPEEVERGLVERLRARARIELLL